MSSKLHGLEVWIKDTRFTGSVLVSATDGGVHEHIVLTPPSKKERLCHLTTRRRPTQDQIQPTD